MRYAVATHERFDHVSTLQELAGWLGAEVGAHENSPIQSSVRVRDGGALKLGARTVSVLHTSGHTEDSICLYDCREVFTGDTLLAGNIVCVTSSCVCRRRP